MRAFRTLITLTLVLIASAAIDGSPQERTSPPPSQQEVPRFRAEVPTVLVDVLVLDENDEPVPGLTRDDFEVLEDRVPQQIEGFDVIDWTSYVAQTSPQGGAPSPSNGSDGAAVNTFPRRFIFIVNRQRAETTYIRRAKQALESFVVESMAEGDEALIIDMGFSTKVLQQFRPSKEETLSTIRKIPILPMDLYGGVGSELGTRNTYETLESLGQGLGQLPGRKIVIFLSPQLTQTTSLLSYLQDTVDALNQSNTSVYSVNIGGLGGVSAAVNESALLTSAESFSIGGLFPLANETGGNFYTNMDTFGPALRQIGQENRSYYLVTYTPSNTDYDGKFRQISVKVDRPNVRVVARRGYFARKRGETQVTDATPPEPPAPPKAPQDTQPDPPTPAPTATPAATPAPTVRSGPSPPDQLEIANYLFPAGDEYEVPITIALPLDMLSAPNGEPLTLKMTITEDTRGVVAEFSDRVDASNFFMVRSPKLTPGLYLLQMTLEEASGEQLYQASTGLEVPQGFGDRFGFSSIVPVFAPSNEASSQAPDIKIRPTPEVQKGEDAYLYFRVLPGEDAGSSGDDAQLSFIISREGEDVVTGAHPSSLQLSRANETGFPVVLRLPTSGLTPGTYRVTLRVASSNLGQRASTEIELTIN